MIYVAKKEYVEGNDDVEKVKIALRECDNTEQLSIVWETYEIDDIKERFEYLLAIMHPEESSHIHSPIELTDNQLYSLATEFYLSGHWRTAEKLKEAGLV